MTRTSRLALALALIAAAAGGAFSQAKAPQIVSVSDARQLVEAIGPDRTIVLKKGDYRLSAAYGAVGKYATWSEGDDGKELSISGVQNLTVRGAEGARIVSDSILSSMIGVYDSKNVTFDNLRFSRLPKAGSDVGAGSFYAESSRGLTLDRCSFDGPTTIAVELWECADAAIKRTTIAGATSGAISASYTQGLQVVSSKIASCEGYPLLYFEETEGVLVRGTLFDGCRGGNFVEIYGGSGGGEPLRFADCSFRDNHVDYFSGTPILPVTEGCDFVDNSFDGNWESDSVAPASDEQYYGGDEEGGEDYRWYDHPSGLSFSYPGDGEIDEYPAQSRVGIFAPDGRSLVFFLTAYAVPSQTDPSKQSKKVFADAYAALGKLLKGETGVGLNLKADGEPYTDNGLLSADYEGFATKGDGERAEARARLIVSGGSVHAMIGLAADASSLEADGDIDAVFGSVESR